MSESVMADGVAGRCASLLLLLLKLLLLLFFCLTLLFTFTSWTVGLAPHRPRLHPQANSASTAPSCRRPSAGCILCSSYLLPPIRAPSSLLRGRCEPRLPACCRHLPRGGVAWRASPPQRGPLWTSRSMERLLAGSSSISLVTSHLAQWRTSAASALVSGALVSKASPCTTRCERSSSSPFEFHPCSFNAPPTGAGM